MTDITISHGQLEAWAGRRLSDEDTERLEEVLHLSTLPEVIGDVFAGMTLDEYWPEEGQPEFVKFAGEQQWRPLCRCGSVLRPHQTSMTNYICESDAHSSPPWMMYLIWAEDWPDYEDEEESDLAIIRKNDTN